MNWLKRNKGKILSVLVIVAILAVSYFADEIPLKNSKNGGSDSEQKILSLPQKIGVDKNNKNDAFQTESATNSNEAIKNRKSEPVQPNAQETESVQSDEQKTEIVQPETEEPEYAHDEKTSCSLSVRCDTINSNIELLDENKRCLIPPDGKIFENGNVFFEEGETVFDVLLREMRNNNIHFEYVDTPIYDSVYIEGINNIYEFDCGALSGWTYRVNGVFPSYGCSQYRLKDEDVIEVLYTCDMGKDIGKG